MRQCMISACQTEKITANLNECRSRQPSTSACTGTKETCRKCIGAFANFWGLTGSLSRRGILPPELGSKPAILDTIAEKLKRQSKDDFRGRHFEARLIVQAASSGLFHFMRASGEGAKTRLTFSPIFCTQNPQRNQHAGFVSKVLFFACNRFE